MNTQNQIIDLAFSRYTSWSLPWKYMLDVHSFPDLSEANQVTIEKIWAEINSEKIWAKASPTPGTELAIELLKNNYPWLSQKSIENLIRAASYNWK